MPKKSAKKTTKKAITKKPVQNTAVKKAVKKATKTAGRPPGSGKYGCPTSAMRIPTHLKDEVQAFVTKKIKAEAKNL